MLSTFVNPIVDARLSNAESSGVGAVEYEGNGLHPRPRLPELRFGPDVTLPSVPVVDRPLCRARPVLSH